MIQWTFIKGTDKRYILLSTGKIFCSRKCDYITPYRNDNNTLFYKLIYSDGSRRCISIKTLLEEHF